MSYLSANDALMYLTNNIYPVIVLLISLYSSCLTRRHWNKIKYIFCYFQETSDIGLFYLYKSILEQISYANTFFFFLFL